MTPLPPDPVGNSRLVQVVRQILRALRERDIIPDPTVEVSKYPMQGSRVRAKGAPRGGGGSGTDDLTWV